MEKIDLPEDLKKQGIYPITIYNDEKGVFIKCLQGRWKRLYVKKENANYEIVKDIELLKYLKENYDIPNSPRGVVF